MKDSSFLYVLLLLSTVALTGCEVIGEPMKFEFIINLKAAKQIGVTIPQWTLTTADKVLKDASAKAGGK